jgi:hypothetical protein
MPSLSMYFVDFSLIRVDVLIPISCSTGHKSVLLVSLTHSAFDSQYIS